MDYICRPIERSELKGNEGILLMKWAEETLFQHVEVKVDFCLLARLMGQRRGNRSLQDVT